MTWNIEGFARNIFNLIDFIAEYQPDLISLSEPQMFSCDLSRFVDYFNTKYTINLNSPDLFDPDLPLLKSKAWGGTMMLWKKSLDPFIVTHPCSTSAIQAIIFHPPRCKASVHICVYLPTSGRENEFVAELSKLSSILHELSLAYEDTPIYIRGDFNVNDNNVKRKSLFDFLLESFALKEVIISHKTYHHFMNLRRSDSNLDKIVCTDSTNMIEQVDKVICGLTNPAVSSSHDIILSSWSAIIDPLHNIASKQPNKTSSVPKIINNRQKTFWTNEGIVSYQQLILPQLARLQEFWHSSAPMSKTSMSLFLQSTNQVLITCARLTNRTVKLSENETRRKPRSTPRMVRMSAKKLQRKAKHLRDISAYLPANSLLVINAMNDFKCSRSLHRKLVRRFKFKDDVYRDANLMNPPSKTFAKIRALKKCSLGRINKLTVGADVYTGDNVNTGFYNAIKSLKSRNDAELQKSFSFRSVTQHFENILKLAEDSPPIKPISEEKSLEILLKMKPDVCDYFSVTPNHYIYAGPAGYKHFHLLLSSLLEDIKNIRIDEVNTAYAVILFKGHGKDKSSFRSYRTISSCPVVAKGLDMYIRDLYVDFWEASRAETQFQGQGRSHEMSALLLTECLQYSMFTLKKPAFVLYLDAQSAFDVVLREILVKNLHMVQPLDQSLLFMNSRLSYRSTIVDTNGCLLGPILDERGLEQGGVASSDLYKIFSREQLCLAQRSSLGVHMGNLVISAIGQADDTVLVSNDIHQLSYLLALTTSFCANHFVTLCAEKNQIAGI